MANAACASFCAVVFVDAFAPLFIACTTGFERMETGRRSKKSCVEESVVFQTCGGCEAGLEKHDSKLTATKDRRATSKQGT